jgi:hypothetical protein
MLISVEGIYKNGRNSLTIEINPAEAEVLKNQN